MNSRERTFSGTVGGQIARGQEFFASQIINGDEGSRKKNNTLITVGVP